MCGLNWKLYLGFSLNEPSSQKKKSILFCINYQLKQKAIEKTSNHNALPLKKLEMAKKTLRTQDAENHNIQNTFFPKNSCEQTNSEYIRS